MSKEVLLGLIFTLLILLCVAVLWSEHRRERQVAFILRHLATHNNAYGLELVRCSGGLLKRGTVYITLGRLEAQGLIESREARFVTHIGLPRYTYSLTELGRAELPKRESRAGAAN